MSELQVASTFTSTPMGPSLGQALAKAGLPPAVGFVQYSQVSHYMLSIDAGSIGGTLVLVRVEDWLRDSLKSQPPKAPVSQQEVRDTLRVRTDEFVTQITALSRRGKPVWFLTCPSNGWIADRHQLRTLFQTYTNLLTTRVRSVPQIAAIQWPAATLSGQVEDRAADRLGQIPFTQEVFDQLGMFVGEQIARTWQVDTETTSTGPDSSEALGEYLRNLHVRVSLQPAQVAERAHVDRLLRTAASVSLTGEQRDLNDQQIDNLLATRECLLVNVGDRLADYGATAMVAYRVDDNEMNIDSMSVSCAVLGKQVEYAMVSGLAQIAASRGCSRLAFEYKPSARNQATLSFLKSFADAAAEGRFELPVAEVNNRIRKATAAPGTWTLELDSQSVHAGKGIVE